MILGGCGEGVLGLEREKKKRRRENFIVVVGNLDN